MEPPPANDGARRASCAHYRGAKRGAKLSSTGLICHRRPHNKCQAPEQNAEVEAEVIRVNANVEDINNLMHVDNCTHATSWQMWQVHKTNNRNSSSRSRICNALILIISTLLILQAITQLKPCQAQFLFTYEINQESDDSRAPKSSLFDPSSFKIVTPAQLQSSYQKLASQPPEQAPLTPPSSSSSSSSLSPLPSSSVQQDEATQPRQPLLDNFAPPTEATASARPAPSTSSPSSPLVGSSFLKQTSAAIQSFAELFNLSPSSSPSPLGLQQLGAEGEAPQSAAPAPLALDQQAEARSLHEHWTQQQQKAHSTLTVSDQQEQQQQQDQHLQHNQLNADHLPALQSFTTASSVGSQAAPSSPSSSLSSPSSSSPSSSSSSQANSQASYWLTSNPLNGPDGNFLVEIKTVDRQQQQQEQPQKLAACDNRVTNLVDNLLSIGQQQQLQQQQQQAVAPANQLQHQHHQLQQQHHHNRASADRLSHSHPQQTANVVVAPAQAAIPSGHHFGMPQQQQQQSAPSLPAPAQSSFLATPTNYYPPSSPATTSLASIQSQFNERNSFRPPKLTTSQQQHSSFATAPAQQQSTQASYLPQTQALHQHQARSLSQQQQPTRASPQSYQADLLDAGQLRPPANTPSNLFGGQAAAATSQFANKPSPSHILNQYQAANHLGPAPARLQQPTQLRSAEESLVAFRQQQQNQHDQQSALLATQQQLVAAAQQDQQHQHQQQSVAGSNQQEPGFASGVALGTREGDIQAGLTGGQYHHSSGALTLTQQQQQQQQQLAGQVEVSSKSPLGDIPKVSPQIYESFLLQQKDQFEKHMELLKQQQELNKLLEQKQKEESEKSKLKQQRQANKKEELERQERAKKERLRAQEQQELQKQQQQQAAAARKARIEAAEALRKQAKLKQELEEKEERERRQRALLEQEEEERRYREFLAAKQRQEEQQARQRELEAREAELKKQREQRDQQERDALEAQQKRRREQQQAAEQQQQYRSYLKQQEELKKLLELKEKEDEAVQATRRRQAATAAAGSTTTVSPQAPAAQSQVVYGSNRTSQSPSQSIATTSSSGSSQSVRANRLALEHKERGRQLSRLSDTGFSQRSGQSPQWGAPVRASRSRYAAASSGDSTYSSSTTVSSNEQSPVSTTSAVASSTLAPQTTSSTSNSLGGGASSQANIGAVVIKRTRASQQASGGGGQPQVSPKKLKAAVDEKLIRQKIPLYSGAGKYGLYRSGSANDSFAELVALLESVTLPPSTSTTTTTTTTTTTPAPTNNYDLADSSFRPETLTPDTSGRRRPMSQADSNMASSLSPLLNVRELSVTPSPFPASTGEPLSSTTIFDDDVPRRPVRNLARLSSLSASQQQQTAASVASPTSVSSSGSVAGVERTTAPLRHGSGTTTASQHGGRTAHIGLASLPADADNDGIPGRAGVEYPVLSAVPQTSFTCSKQPLNGYYADTETACQVVHLCQGGVQSSILCPNGTIFNQEKFSCQWWYEVNCSRAPMFYQLNDNLYKSAALTSTTSGTTDGASTTTGGGINREIVRLSEQRKPRTRTQASTTTTTSSTTSSTLKESLNDL